MFRHGVRTWRIYVPALMLLSSGCMLGPRSLERSHLPYNEALKESTDEQLLLNLVRLRYNEDLQQLDVASIAAQYEANSSVEARPFFLAPNPSNSNVIFKTFTSILPAFTANAANRPTISFTPLDDPENIRPLFVPSTLDGLIFLAETSWPVSTVFRLWVDQLNDLANAPQASGPSRGIAPVYQEFQRATQLIQELQDAGALRFASEASSVEHGDPIPESAVTAAAQVEAARNGYEFRQKKDKTWVLTKRGRRLELRINPEFSADGRAVELRTLLHLKPDLNEYEVRIGGPDSTFQTRRDEPLLSEILIYPRSTVQALFYISYGVEIPPEHIESRVVKPTLGPDGTPFDWQQMTNGLFTVHSAKQFCRPPCAYIAIRYRDRWYYIDDRDTDSKITFALMMTMTRVNLLGSRKGGPALTLPVGK